MTYVYLVVGLVLLTVGAEVLIRGAVALALAIRISPLVVGLTVVAFGTSAPELVVSVQSGLAGESEIALGNVVGSNIVNVLLILGLSACITPLIVAQQLVRLDVPLMIGVSVLTLLLGLDGTIGRVDGLLFVTGLVIYTVWAIRASRRESLAVAQEYTQELDQPAPKTLSGVALQLLLIIVGLVMLVGGARLLLDAAIDIARSLGVSELVIGLTIVALGTSLPEVATSVMAAIRGERDIAVGNVVGSNLFNILSVLGLTAVVSPQGVTVPPEALRVDLPVMIAVAFACLPVFFTGHVIARWEGAVFLGYYFAYTAWLFLNAVDPLRSGSLAWALITVVIPLTALTLAVTTWRSWRAAGASGGSPPGGQ